MTANILYMIVQIKILVVFTTKAGPLSPGKALVILNSRGKNHKIA